MVLVVVRQEAGLVARWPKTVKKESENDSRQIGDLTKNRQSDSLKTKANSLFLRG
jgi:hypothetical protein